MEENVCSVAALLVCFRKRMSSKRHAWSSNDCSSGDIMGLQEHRNADTSLQALYGDNARWIGFHRRSS